MARETPVQDAILEVVRDYKLDPRNNGNSPTYGFIAECTGHYKANIHKAVAVMITKGLLSLTPDRRIALPDVIITLRQ